VFVRYTGIRDIQIPRKNISRTGIGMIVSLTQILTSTIHRHVDKYVGKSVDYSHKRHDDYFFSRLHKKEAIKWLPRNDFQLKGWTCSQIAGRFVTGRYLYSVRSGNSLSSPHIFQAILLEIHQ
jgi:hypothetical protein